jgi:2-polyprenyl-6-methoxyphenol hydroxylase-like FAD-dependent oxidoreductase
LAVTQVLVVGGGVGGMSCAISLRRAGLAVDLLEIDPCWTAYACGITAAGPATCAMQTLGVLDEVRRHGASWEGADYFNQTGEPIASAAAPAATVGILRSELHKLLAAKTLAAGVHVRLGTTVETLSLVPGGVAVKLTNGHRERYGLVVGADGIYSKVRERLFPDTPPPTLTGQVVYRLIAERPRDFARTHIYQSLTALLALHPLSRTHLFLLLLQRAPANPWVAPEDQPRQLHQALNGWGGIAAEIRQTVMTTNAHSINYRPLDAVQLAGPTHRDRVLLIGDAAGGRAERLHDGVGAALEDGVVLAQEIARDGDIDAALPRFMARRRQRGALFERGPHVLAQHAAGPIPRPARSGLQL